MRGERAEVRLSAPLGLVQRLDSFEHLDVIDAGARDGAGQTRGLRLQGSGLWVTAGEVGRPLHSHPEICREQGPLPRVAR